MSVLQSNIYKLKGRVQNYAWGGYSFLPQLLHFQNTENKPCAEYWMGAHPSAPSMLQTPSGELSLYEAINANAERILTNAIHNRFGELPYLYKILDVNEMLSIQVHPTKEEAVKGLKERRLQAFPSPHHTATIKIKTTNPK